MVNELIQKLQELKPGKGEFTVGNTNVLYDINDNGYTINMISTSNSDDKKVSDTKYNEILEAARKKAETETRHIEKYIELFRSDMEKLDDDIFSTACDIFNKFGNINVLGNHIKEAKDFKAIRSGVNDFKQTVNAVINREINRLKSQFQTID